MLFTLEGNKFPVNTTGGCVKDSLDIQRSVWIGCHLPRLYLIADRANLENSLEGAAIVSVCLYSFVVKKQVLPHTKPAVSSKHRVYFIGSIL